MYYNCIYTNTYTYTYVSMGVAYQYITYPYTHAYNIQISLYFPPVIVVKPLICHNYIVIYRWVDKKQDVI